MPIVFQWPSAAAATVSLTFQGALVQMTHPQTRPLQFQLVAESGKLFVVQRASIAETYLEIRFLDLHEGDMGSLAGFSSLQSFLSTTTSWAMSAFTVTDVDLSSYFGRYVGGFDTFQEAVGRSQRATRWTGTITFRKEI